MQNHLGTVCSQDTYCLNLITKFIDAIVPVLENKPNSQFQYDQRYRS